jgi:hypothetical protein
MASATNSTDERKNNYKDESKDKITLVSSDNKKFETTRKSMEICDMISAMISFEESNKHTFDDIHSEELSRLVEFCELFVEHPFNITKPVIENSIKKIFPKQYYDIFNIPSEELVKLANVARKQMCEPLVDACSATIAISIKNLPIDELRVIFGVKNDLTKKKDEILKKKYTQVVSPPC